MHPTHPSYSPIPDNDRSASLADAGPGAEHSKTADPAGMTHSSLIHPDRYPSVTPVSLVDDHGQCRFGTFEKEILNFQLEKAHHPTRLPNLFNGLKLTQWQAAEIHLDSCLFLCAVCDMGLFGKILMVYFDKETHEVLTFDSTLLPHQVEIAPHLCKGTRSEGRGVSCGIEFFNVLDRGKTRISGHSCAKGHTVSFDFSLSRLSPPSVVSIPFGPNRPLYSQKDFLKASGSLTIDGKTIHSDSASTGILDDHRGYYPRRSHYDWVTTLGVLPSLPNPGWFAINLTRNQSIDQARWNENLIWLDNQSFPLPPVIFEKTGSLAAVSRKEPVTWHIHDVHGLIDLRFDIQGVSPMVLHAGIVQIDYYILFGVLNGTIKDPKGNIYPILQLPAIGEDKTLLF